MRKTQKTDFAVDLSDDMLKKLYDLDIIENETSFGYTYDKDGNIYKNKIDGINNFSSYAKEVLVFGEIKQEHIKCVIYPLLQDIIYSCNIDINRNIDFIIKNMKTINNVINKKRATDGIFNTLYPSIDSNVSLTDLIEEYFKDKDCIDIENYYRMLKEFKMQELADLVSLLNKKLKTNWQVSRIVDDKVIVCNYGRIKQYSNIQLNDIVLIGKDNRVYKYSNKECAYIDKYDDKIKIKK